MKIRALRVAEIGGFTEPVAVEGFGGGLDVLVGPNELGKSTLLTALEAVLLVRHASRSRQGLLERILPDRAGAPLIEVDLEAEGKLWRLRKRFWSSPMASLIDLADGAVVARGDEASQRAAALLGQPTGEARREHVPVGLLWVEQAASFEPPVAKEGALLALQKVIEAEVRSLEGGDIARRVVALARKRLGELVTDGRRNPRKGGALADALTRRDVLATALADSRRASALDADRRARLRVLEVERQALEAPEAEHAARAAVESAETTLATAEKAREELRVLEQRAALAEATAIEAERALAAEVERAAEVRRIRSEHSLARAAAARAAEQFAALIEAGVVIRAEAERAEEDQEQAEKAWHDTLRRMAEAQRRRQWRELADRHREASRLAADIEEMTRALERLPPVTAGRLAVLGRSEREIAALEAQREGRLAAAPTLTVAYAPGGSGRVRAGGRIVADGERLHAAPRLDLEIAGVGRLTIEGGVELDDLDADLAAHRRSLAATLAAIGVASVAAAAAAQAERERCEQVRAAAGATFANLAPEGLACLGSELEALDAATAAEPNDRGAAELSVPDPVSAEVRLAVTRDAAVAARAAVTEHERREAGVLRLRDTENDRAGALEARLGEIDPGSPDARSGGGSSVGSDRDVAVSGDDPASLLVLRAHVATAKSALAVLQRERATWLTASPDAATRVALEQRLSDARRAVVRRDEERARLLREIERIEGALEAAGGRGRRQSEAELEEALGRAEVRLAQIWEDVAALELLIETLVAVETEQQGRLREPLGQRLAPYLAMLVPGAEIEIATSLAVEGYRRDGRPQRFERASKGTREQIAVLVRLAYARLLADRGEPLPVVLDDALVFSDDERLARMFTVLEEASNHHQVIVATCHARGFAGLGGSRLTIRPWRFADDGEGP